MNRLKWSLITCLTAIFLLYLQSCALKPVAWQPAPKPAFEDVMGLNDKLTQAKKINLKGWYGPEDIVFDASDNLYCGVHRGDQDFSDGKILKISPDGKVEIFFDAGSWVAGLHVDKSGNLLALSHKQGLICISPDKKVIQLAQQDAQGRKFYIPNGMDVDAASNVYFTNTSDVKRYDVVYGRKLILEQKPNGGLYKRNAQTRQVETLLYGTYFGNGVAVSKDESYLLMVETTKYRVLKYWLKGANQGKTELFLDNLPGFPNGISRREDGTFWLGFTTKRNDVLDYIHPKPFLKKLVYALPEFMQPKQDKFGMIMHISEKGKILETLFDSQGTILPEAGAVKEHKGYLYIGGDNTPWIGVYKLS